MIAIYKMNEEEMLDALTTWLKNHKGIRVPGDDKISLKWFNSSSDEEVGDCNLVPVITFENGEGE